MNQPGDTPAFAAGEVDLFGPDPETNPLAYYAEQAPAGDLFAQSEPGLRKTWEDLARGFASQCQGDLSALQGYLDRHVEDLGLAFRMTGDEQERAWPLGPMPILIAAKEWESVTQGLIQRAELLERVIADLYGEQRLVREGHLPAAVVSGSNDFARRMVGIKPASGHFMHTYAVDLARGCRDQRWRMWFWGKSAKGLT